MTVRELIGGDVIAVAPESSLLEAVRLLHSNEIGALAVEVDGYLEGILTERDIIHACAADAALSDSRVDEWMTAYPDTFTPDLGVQEAADWMLAAGYRHLPVVEDDRPIGMLSVKDILWALAMPPVE